MQTCMGAEEGAMKLAEKRGAAGGQMFYSKDNL